MERKFQSGEPVVLISGGSSRKTVVGYDAENGKVVCSWEANNKKHEESYYEFELEKWVKPFTSKRRSF